MTFLMYHVSGCSHCRLSFSLPINLKVNRQVTLSSDGLRAGSTFSPPIDIRRRRTCLTVFNSDSDLRRDSKDFTV